MTTQLIFSQNEYIIFSQWKIKKKSQHAHILWKLHNNIYACKFVLNIVNELV